nr:tyrosine--tRNA ligase [Candidatus Omnitrophota bacterium]
QFQDLGHQVAFLVGDFTARIGDPTGQSKIRKILTDEEIKENAATYTKQAYKILLPEKTKVVFNSSWFDAMNGLEFAKLLTHYTATRLLERDDFSLRLKANKPLYMSELLYPILQGYDSVVLRADIEVGGSDQKFNLLVGRDLQKDFGQPPQAVITMPLLEGIDGVQKMSKSYNNYVGVNDSAQEMFGKIMSIPDELMVKYFELLTQHDVHAIRSMHPKEAKVLLAHTIVTEYHSSQAADMAQAEFNRVFSQHEVPHDIAVFRVDLQQNKIIDVLVASGLVESKNEARRLIQQGGVLFEGVRIASENTPIEKNGILKVGKRRFIKIEI